MTNEEINAICLTVYRARLNAECKGDADRQLEKDDDGGKKQASRAQFYRPVVTETLIAVGLHERSVKAPPPRARDEALSEVGRAAK